MDVRFKNLVHGNGSYDPPNKINISLSPSSNANIDLTSSHRAHAIQNHHETKYQNRHQSVQDAYFPSGIYLPSSPIKIHFPSYQAKAELSFR